jgi:signal transduction histidine kinase
MSAAGAGFLLGSLLVGLLLARASVRRSSVQLKRAKEQFIALSSHYLLTPISIIQGAVAQLQERDSSLTVEQRQKLYGSVFKGQQRLWILAEQFILVSQIEEGMLQLKLEAGDVTALAENAAESVDIFAREKEIQVKIDDQTSANREARFDHRRMRQALVAVLDNAIKFSPEGSTVQVSILPEDSAFAFDVTDVGTGMPSETVRRITSTFTRGTSSYTFDHEGIGLGLFIANAIMREHGGELRIVSGKRGTTVTLRFPTI